VYNSSLFTPVLEKWRLLIGSPEYSETLCPVQPFLYSSWSWSPGRHIDPHWQHRLWYFISTWFHETLIGIHVMIKLDSTVKSYTMKIKVKVAHTQLPSTGFRSWSRFLVVSLQVTWVINQVVGCHYFLPGPNLPLQPLRGLLPVLLLGEQRHNGCEQFA